MGLLTSTAPAVQQKPKASPPKVSDRFGWVDATLDDLAAKADLDEADALFVQEMTADRNDGDRRLNGDKLHALRALEEKYGVKTTRGKIAD